MVRYLFYTIGDLTYQSPLVEDQFSKSQRLLRYLQVVWTLTLFLSLKHRYDTEISSLWGFYAAYNPKTAQIPSTPRRKPEITQACSSLILGP